MKDDRATGLERAALEGLDLLKANDPRLFELLCREYDRQNEVLTMVAASSLADPSVLACAGSATVNVTTEGYPGARFHAGCEVVDEIERMAVERAKACFGARYANVQPHSGTSANAIVMFSLLQAGDKILGLDLDAGGHLTHGSKASISGQYFEAIAYGLTDEGWIDYDAARALALEHRPKLVICGASSYSRKIDFARFREIADEIGAYLLADVSHIAGLIAGGEHPSPVDHAHFTTCSTYKQLCGPRGGLILIGRDVGTLAPDGKRTLPELVQRAVFPFFQGTPNLGAIAGKARALAMASTPEFRAMTRRIVEGADALARWFVDRGYRVLTGGTENHTVLVDVFSRGITGVNAEKALERCGIVVNKNRIAGDTKSAFVTSGLRLGTNSLAVRGMGAAEAERCAPLVDRVLSSVRPVSDKEFELDDAVVSEVREEVRELCRRFPIPNYPLGELPSLTQA
jgi:glycine hydroxymethyltransferase